MELASKETVETFQSQLNDLIWHAQQQGIVLTIERKMIGPLRMSGALSIGEARAAWANGIKECGITDARSCPYPVDCAAAGECLCSDGIPF